MALIKLNLAQGVTGTLPNANFSGGKVAQLLQSQATSQTALSSSSYSSISLSQAITPSATSSKVLIMGYVKFSIGETNGDRGFGLRIRRDTTAIQTSATIYDLYHKSTNSQFTDGGRFPFMYIDSPSSTSEITYSIRIASWNSQSITIQGDSNASQIQCWEILA